MRNVILLWTSWMIILCGVLPVRAQTLPENTPESSGAGLPVELTDIDDLASFISSDPENGSDKETEEMCDSILGCDSTFIYPGTLASAKPLKPGDFIRFTTYDIKGTVISSDELFARRKVTMINLWSVTCSACLSEMGELTRMNQEYAARGGQIVGLAYDAFTKEMIREAREISDDLMLPFVVLLPNKSIYELFPTQSFPVTFFIDSEGKVLGEPVIGARTAVYRNRMEAYLSAAE